MRLAEQPAGLQDLTDDELRIWLADRRAGLARVENDKTSAAGKSGEAGRTLCCHVDRGRDRATSLAAHAGVGPHHVSDDDEDR
jgi:hypothetical protein